MFDLKGVVSWIDVGVVSEGATRFPAAAHDPQKSSFVLAVSA
ncbi:hypothetical protein ACFV0C_23130 [Streptomyces sp. NPDC059568]